MTIIAFISQKGGVGKSTLAQALATEANKKKFRTLLADCDSQQATSQEWSKIQGKIPCQIFNSVHDIWPLSKNYDLIIIDGPARTSQSTLQIARQADLIIQPTGASRADLQPAVKEFHALKAAGINPKKLLFVINRVASEAEAKAAQNYLSQTGYQVVTPPLYEKSSYREAQNRGESIANVRYKNLSHQVRKLVYNILAYL
ncbi:MAG: ParA-like protein [Mycoplasmataceae bacterium RV_VA103A]|nr:MAG: ParA-like protein [Mycoplasmataceae bacterium RV_VA103A]